MLGLPRLSHPAAHHPSRVRWRRGPCMAREGDLPWLGLGMPAVRLSLSYVRRRWAVWGRARGEWACSRRRGSSSRGRRKGRKRERRPRQRRGGCKDRGEWQTRRQWSKCATRVRGAGGQAEKPREGRGRGTQLTHQQHTANSGMGRAGCALLRTRHRVAAGGDDARSRRRIRRRAFV